MCVDHLCMATSEFSVQHDELVQELLNKCVMGYSMCAIGYLLRMLKRGFSVDTQKTIKQRGVFEVPFFDQ